MSSAARTLYVDVSCVRIQRYLSRTTRLRGRRGASAALAEATRFDENTRPFSDAELNPEAGEADGVVNLRVTLDGDEEPREIDGRARALAQRVFARLRKKLPGAEFQAVWGTGSGYLETYHHTIGPRLRRGDVLTDLPPVAEFSYARMCELCYLDPAQVRVVFREEGAEPEERFACPDCEQRFSRESNQLAGTAEQRLMRHLGKQPVDHLTALAQLNSPLTDRNHVATVLVDGNAFGDFFAQLATHDAGPGTVDKAEISRALNQHTHQALREAAEQVNPEQQDTLCVVPHLVGGDDVLVSLPADRGWEFTRCYLWWFGQLVDQERASVLAQVPHLPRLSASAGIVFSRHSAPFYQVVEEAERLLARAKSLTRGQEATVAAKDLTTGDAVEPPVRLSDLDEHEEPLRRLAELPASARHTLATLLRRSPEDTTAVENQARRLGHWNALEPFLTPDTPIRLSQALPLLRWWR